MLQSWELDIIKQNFGVLYQKVETMVNLTNFRTLDLLQEICSKFKEDKEDNQQSEVKFAVAGREKLLVGDIIELDCEGNGKEFWVIDKNGFRNISL